MSRRVRFVSARIEFQYMVDDGTNLEPLVVTNDTGEACAIGKLVAAADWEKFCESGLAEITTELQRAVDGTPTGPPPDSPS